MTTIEGLLVSDLCENKIAVSPDVQKEMERLRTDAKLSLSVTPVYSTDEVSFKLCYLNARSLHKHIDDIRKDLNYTNTDINIISETRFINSDEDTEYELQGYELFRNDSHAPAITRPVGGTAVYSRIPYFPGYPYSQNINGIEITIIKVFMLPHVTILGFYRSPTISVNQLCRTVQQLLQQYSSEYCIFIGDFNCDWLNASNRTSLYNLFIRDYSYRQLVTQYTTNYRTCLDHIYTNLPMSQVAPHVLETYFTDHKQCVL